MIFEKKLFKTLVVSLTGFMIMFSSIKVIFSSDLILLDSNCLLTTFQNVLLLPHLDFHSIPILGFLRKETQ